MSAAAGSGKTAVLVERIIQMITEGENPKDIDRLLVMTFTRAAAAEMRERIQAAIEKKLESEPENEHLQQQAVLVQFAPDHDDRQLLPAYHAGTILTGWTSIRHSGSAMRAKGFCAR